MRDKAKGFTLIELIIVVGILAILIIVAGYEFTGWIAKYRVESQIKQMHADVMGARVRAMQRNMPYIVELATNQYVICEDANVNNMCDNPGETTNSNISQALSKFNLRYQLNWGLGGGSVVSLDRRGIAAPVQGGVIIPPWPVNGGSIWLVQPSGAVWGAGDVDYDCIVITDTRINMGKWDGPNAICQER